MSKAKKKLAVAKAKALKAKKLKVSEVVVQTVSVSVEGVAQTVQLKIEKGNNTDWLSTIQDRDQNKLFNGKIIDGFSMIAHVPLLSPSASASMLDGVALSEGEIIQVQFPKGSLVELEVHVNKNGCATHRSWWQGVAVEISLDALPARRISSAS